MLPILVASIFVMSLFCVNSSQAQQSINDQNQAYPHSNHNKPLRIAVAANFTPVLKILLKDFTKQTGIKSQIISGASGAMFLQIKHGAPFDIFLSADSRRPKDLEQTGYALQGSRKTYAMGQLALYSSSVIPDLSADVNSLEHLSITAQPSINQLVLEQLNQPPARFAIANPEIAPYGKAAKEALIHLGLWHVYEPRLIKGINISQTFAQLRSKAVALGIVANSQLVLNNLSGVVIPSGYHQPIEQQLIIVGASKRHMAAEKLSDFLLSVQSQQTIVSYGYAQFMHVNHQNEALNELATR